MATNSSCDECGEVAFLIGGLCLLCDPALHFAYWEQMMPARAAMTALRVRQPSPEEQN